MIDFPPSAGWTLRYILRGPQTIDFSATASADGTKHEVRRNGAATQGHPPGLYSMLGRVEHSDGHRYAVHESALHVDPDPVTAEASHAEALIPMLQAQEKELAVKAALASWTQGGRSETLAQLADVRRKLAELYEQVRRERGGAMIQSVGVRFGPS